MSFKQLQTEVDRWIRQYPEGYWDAHAIVTHVLEEMGEVAREVHHIHGPKRKKHTENENELGTEITDAMFALICLANKHNIDLNNAWKKTMNKRYVRDKNRFPK